MNEGAAPQRGSRSHAPRLDVRGAREVTGIRVWIAEADDSIALLEPDQ